MGEGHRYKKADVRGGVRGARHGGMIRDSGGGVKDEDGTKDAIAVSYSTVSSYALEVVLDACTCRQVQARSA